MAEFSPSVLERAKGSWDGLVLQRKIVIVIVVAGALLSSIALIIWSRKSDFALLYSNLSPEDASSIKNELRISGVPFKQSSDGTSLLAPSKDVYRIRMELASKGLPEAGGLAGFEIFDESKLGMTDFVQKLQYQRALQGELARTISQMDEVCSARVHLAMPRATVFTEREQPAKASVILNLYPGKRLNQKRVEAISHMVANAVEGLKGENITIIDTSGHVLSNGIDKMAFNSLTQDRLEYQRALEAEYKGRVQSMLERALGPDKAIVSVAIEVDPDSTEVTQEKYDPDDYAISQEQKIEETEEGILPTAWGAPGVTSNTTLQTNPSTQNLSKYTKEESTLSYQVSRTLSHTIKRGGEIKRLSVAAIVDSAYETAADGTQQSIPRTQQEMQKLRSIVEKAVGYHPGRGDTIEVQNIAFDTSMLQREKAMMEAMERHKLWHTLGKIGGILVAVLLAYFLLLRPFFKTIKVRKALIKPEALPQPAEEIPEKPTPIEAPGEEEKLAETSEFKQMKAELMAVAGSEAEVIAELLKRWLEEESVQSLALIKETSSTEEEIGGDLADA